VVPAAAVVAAEIPAIVVAAGIETTVAMTSTGIRKDGGVPGVTYIHQRRFTGETGFLGRVS
jgi:hypothetical protein